MAVAHLALNLGARHESRHGVDDDHVDRARTDQGLRDFQRLLAGVRLRNQKGIHVHTQRARIHGIQCVLHVDKRRVAAVLLPFRDAVQRQRRLTGAFRPVDLDDSAARQAADTKRQIQRKRSGRDGFHVHRLILAQTHDGSLAELLFNLRQRRLQRRRLIRASVSRSCLIRHENLSFFCRFRPLAAHRTAARSRLPRAFLFLLYRDGQAKATLFLIFSNVCCFFAFVSGIPFTSFFRKSVVYRIPEGFSHNQDLTAVTTRSKPLKSFVTSTWDSPACRNSSETACA